MFEAILFDLDGTLVNNNMKSFIDEYFLTLGPRIAQYCPEGDYVRTVLLANKPMFETKKSKVTLKELFLTEFKNITGLNEERIEQLFNDYYENEYKNISIVKPIKQSLECLQAAAKITDNIVVATSPIFPVNAIQQRLHWGNITDFDFKLITGCDIMHTSKPHPEYFLEIADILNSDPKKCLMIGNDHIDDMAAKGAGMQTFLLKNFALNKGKGYYKADYTGNMKGLLKFLMQSQTGN